jgi:surfeit locus 1 family protein
VSARWIVGSVLVAAIVAGCVSAGFWQLRRLDERRETNAQVRTRSARVIDLPEEGFGDEADDDALVYRRVRVTGTYDPDHELLARFRTRKGLPGYEVITPLVTDDGVVLVDRGWVPLELGDRWPVERATPPTGEVEVEGLLTAAESGGASVTRSAPRRVVISAIAPRALSEAAGAADLPVYAVPLLAQGASADYPVPVDPPDLGEGPHRDYAVQWFLFATVGVVGWVALLFRRGPFARSRRTLRA